MSPEVRGSGGAVRLADRAATTCTWLYPLCEPSILCDCYHDLIRKGRTGDISLYAIYGAGCLLGIGWVGRRNAGGLGEVCCHWERHVNDSKV